MSSALQCSDALLSSAPRRGHSFNNAGGSVLYDVTVVRRLIQFRNATSKHAVLAHRCFALKVELM